MVKTLFPSHMVTNTSDGILELITRRVYKLSFLFLILILCLSTYPIQTSQVLAQETVPPPDETGPYQVGYTIVFNISKKPGSQLALHIYYPAEETGKDASIDKSNAPYPTLFTSTGKHLVARAQEFRQFAERISSHGPYLWSSKPPSKISNQKSIYSL